MSRLEEDFSLIVVVGTSGNCSFVRERDDSMNALSSDLEFAESESERGRESLHGGRVSRVE